MGHSWRIVDSVRALGALLCLVLCAGCAQLGSALRDFDGNAARLAAIDAYAAAPRARLDRVSRLVGEFERQQIVALAGGAVAPQSLSANALGLAEEDRLAMGCSAAPSLAELTGLQLAAQKASDAADSKSEAAKDEAKKFHGLSLAPALMFTGGGVTEIDSASLGTRYRRRRTAGAPLKTKSVVVVDKERGDDARLGLEIHYFLTPFWDAGGDTTTAPELPPRATFGVGPFVSIQAAGEDAIEGMGYGLMAGFHVGEGKSFNFGLGRFLDRNVKQLGSGFREGAAPPGGATEVKFRETSEWRDMAIFSFTWQF